MPKPLIVDIPHDLGRDEAKRRLEHGTDQARAFLAKSGIAVDQLAWTGDRLDFGVSAMAQKVAGTIDVGAESVRLRAVATHPGQGARAREIARRTRAYAYGYAVRMRNRAGTLSHAELRAVTLEGKAVMDDLRARF